METSKNSHDIKTALRFSHYHPIPTFQYSLVTIQDNMYHRFDFDLEGSSFYSVRAEEFLLNAELAIVQGGLFVPHDRYREHKHFHFIFRIQYNWMILQKFVNY